jgi:hypothetical protein
MGCSGNCGQACCDVFPFKKWKAYNREHRDVGALGALEMCLGPNNLPGVIDPATGQCVVMYPWSPELPTAPNQPTGQYGWCDTPTGAPGYQTPGGCIPIADFAEQCTTPQGGPGWRFPGGPCMSAGPEGPTLPPGLPPELPGGGELPGGVVYEAACQQREAAAAAKAKDAEESKVVKYAAITGVVSAVVGYAVARLF